MSVHAPFEGERGGNQVVTTGAASASVTVNAVSKSVRLVNAGGTNPCHVRIGQSPQTATTADLPVLAGESIVLQKREGGNTVAYIQSGGATTLHIQPGEGGI